MMISFILGPINFHTRLDGVVLLPSMTLPDGWSKGRQYRLPPAPANDRSGRAA